MDELVAPLSPRHVVMKGAIANSKLPYDSKADGQLPRRYTALAPLQSPVRNQGRRGTCTIFASIGLMEHLYIMAGMPTPDFSEQYLEWSVKVQYGVGQDYEGSDNPDNLAAIAEYGIVEEALDPYNPLPWTEANDPDCARPADPQAAETAVLPTKCYTQGDPPASVQAARKYTLPPGNYLNTGAIKQHMVSTRTAVVVSLPVFFQAWSHGFSMLPLDKSRWRQGVVVYPNQADIDDSDARPAGHGFVLVGYDDDMQYPLIGADGQPLLDAAGNEQMDQGFFVFKNSWGTTVFGTENPYGVGYGFISYRYINDFASAYVAGVPNLSTP
jgi:C1A family cysteine protease